MSASGPGGDRVSPAGDGLTDNDVRKVMRQHQRTGESLGRCLVAMGWPDEASGLKALAQALGIRFLDLGTTQIDPEAAGSVPPEILQSKRVIPVQSTDSRLLLAMANPLDFETVDHIRIQSGLEVERAVCTESDLESETFEKGYPLHKNIS